MTIRIIGAGLPRTGTNSLKLALERLLGEPCYHMYEVLSRREDHIPLWIQVFQGDLSVTDKIFNGFGAAVDWPVSALWREMAEHYPDVPVVLSRRSSTDAWWQSADKTICALMRTLPDDPPHLFQFLAPQFANLRPDLDVTSAAVIRAAADDEAGMKAAYERHLDDVRAGIDPSRLVEFEPADGWEPLCQALGVPVPDEPYPRGNTTDDFLKYFEENPVY